MSQVKPCPFCANIPLSDDYDAIHICYFGEKIIIPLPVWNRRAYELPKRENYNDKITPKE